MTTFVALTTARHIVPDLTGDDIGRHSHTVLCINNIVLRLNDSVITFFYCNDSSVYIDSL